MTEQLEQRIVFLRGERVYFRPVEPSDLERFQRWINEPETRRTLASFVPLNSLAEREWLENQGKSKNDFAFAIARTADDAHIGACGLHQISWKNRVALFGIMIGEPAARGQGFGSEATQLVLRYAFETLNLNRVELDVYAFNAAGIRAYEKVGFTREGVLREHVFVDGRYVDVFRYAMLAREYFADRS